MIYKKLKTNEFENTGLLSEIDASSTYSDAGFLCENVQNIWTLEYQQHGGRRYQKIPGIGKRILRSLADGRMCCKAVADKLEVSKQIVNYWKDKGLEKGIIIPYGGVRPAYYTRGPHYHDLKLPGWPLPVLGPIQCRVHAPCGGHIRYIAVIGEMYHIPITLDDGSLFYHPLFPIPFGPRTNWSPRTVHIPIPVEYALSMGATATIVLGTIGSSDALFVSPPPVYQTIHQFQRGGNPFSLIQGYIERLLERDGGWFLDELDNDFVLHYAFKWDDVKRCCPELLKGIPKLRRGTDPAKMVLYCDESHRIKEYETTSKQIASDIFAILEAERKRIIGGRKTPKPRLKLLPYNVRRKRKVPIDLYVEMYLKGEQKV